MKKGTWITISIIVVVILIAIFVTKKPESMTTEEVAKCIGDKSTLYVQLGCPHCKTQEEMFGDNVKFLNEVDCFFERDKCGDAINATPTWVISGRYYEGIQSIDNLKTYTGC